MAIKLKHSDTFSTYFITFTCTEWIPLFDITNSYDLVYKWFNILKEKYCAGVVSYVIMATHVMHLLNKTISMKYLLGLYNSTLLNFIYQNRVNESGRVFAQVKTINVKPLPIKLIDFTNKNEKHSHDQIVTLVEQLLQLNKDLQATTLETKKEQLKTKIDYCENKINQLVYQLYNLTAEEIKIIES